ncbi:hypothetical protein AB6813_12180 [bacterium RCC_150]
MLKEPPTRSRRPSGSAPIATFLRRADKIDLHAAAVRDVETSFTETFASAEITIAPDLTWPTGQQQPPEATPSSSN